jgi:hypothetical protein
VPAAEHADLAEEAALERARRQARLTLSAPLDLFSPSDADAEHAAGAAAEDAAHDGDDGEPEWLTECQLIAMLEHRLGAVPLDG